MVFPLNKKPSQVENHSIALTPLLRGSSALVASLINLAAPIHTQGSQLTHAYTAIAV